MYAHLRNSHMTFVAESLQMLATAKSEADAETIQGLPKLTESSSHFPKVHVLWTVLNSKAGCIRKYSNIGYSIQELVAAVIEG